MKVKFSRKHVKFVFSWAKKKRISTLSNYHIVLFIHSTIILLNTCQALLHENAMQKFQRTFTELLL